MEHFVSSATTPIMVGLANNTTYHFTNLDLITEKNCLLGIEAGNYKINYRDLFTIRDIKELADNGQFQIAQIDNGKNILTVTMIEAKMKDNGKKIAIAKICQECNKIEKFALSDKDVTTLLHSMAIT